MGVIEVRARSKYAKSCLLILANKKKTNTSIHTRLYFPFPVFAVITTNKMLRGIVRQGQGLP